MLTPEDLEPFAVIEEAKAIAMIEDAMSMAALVAPCLADDSEVELKPHQVATVKAILRRAVLRWNDAGTGAIVQESTGPWSQTVDTTRSSKSLFWPSEVNDLQAVCRAAGGDEPPDKRVFTVNTGGRRRCVHSPICDLYFGGLHCSCGSDLNAFRGPLPQFGEVM